MLYADRVRYSNGRTCDCRIGLEVIVDDCNLRVENIDGTTLLSRIVDELVLLELHVGRVIKVDRPASQRLHI